MFVLPFYIYSLAANYFQKYFKDVDDYQELINDSISSLENNNQLTLTSLKAGSKVGKRKTKCEKNLPFAAKKQFDGLLVNYILNIDKFSLDYCCKTLNNHDRPIEKFVLDFQNENVFWHSLEENIILFLDNIITQIYLVNYGFSELSIKDFNYHQKNASKTRPISTTLKFITTYKNNYSFIKSHKKLLKYRKRINKRKIKTRLPQKGLIFTKTCDEDNFFSNEDSAKIKSALFPNGADLNKHFLQDIVEQRFNLNCNAEYLMRVLTKDAYDEYDNDWTVTIYVEHNINVNKNFNFIEMVKEDLVTGLLESHFPKHTSLTFIRHPSIKGLLCSWEADKSVAPVFPHQRLTDTYTCALVLSQCSSQLLRHPHLAFYETLSHILQMSVEYILTAIMF